MTPASFFEFWSDAFVVKCRLCRRYCEKLLMCYDASRKEMIIYAKATKNFLGKACKGSFQYGEKGS